MSSFMLLCGPSHAEIVEASEGATVIRPAAPSVDDLLAGRLTPSPPDAQIEYRPWALEDRIGPRFTGFKLMIADGASDIEAISLFRDMVQRYDDRPRTRSPRMSSNVSSHEAASRRRRSLEVGEDASRAPRATALYAVLCSDGAKPASRSWPDG